MIDRVQSSGKLGAGL